MKQNEIGIGDWMSVYVIICIAPYNLTEKGINTHLWHDMFTYWVYTACTVNSEFLLGSDFFLV